jgi:hypothetical protein
MPGASSGSQPPCGMRMQTDREPKKMDHGKRVMPQVRMLRDNPAPAKWRTA